MNDLPVEVQDRRRSVRFSAALPAMIWVGAGAELHPCTVLDISLHGCRLRLENGDSIPDHFTLLLTMTGTVRRPCKVVWRKDDLFGVEFVNGSDRPEGAQST